MSAQELRADVADVLDLPESEVPLAENLIDHGLDSVRIMELAERWRVERGADLTFADLAEEPTLERWATLLTAAA